MASTTKTTKIPKLRFPGFGGEWEEKKLGSFLNQEVREVSVPEKPYLGLGIRSHFKGLMQRPDSDPSKIMMDKLYVVRPDDLVVNITFAWEGAIAIAEEEDNNGLVSHRFPTYRFHESVVLGNFFRYVYPSKRFKYELGLASPGGAGRNRVLSKRDFLQIKVNVPLVEEQQKIAGFLGVADKKISVLERKKELLQKYKKGVMQTVFSQKIRFKVGNGKDYPEWQEKKLGEICLIISGQSPKGSAYNKEGVGTPLYQGKADFGAMFTAEPEIWTTEETKIAEPNDILVSVRAPVGPANLASQRINIGRGLAAIRPWEGSNYKYIFYFLRFNEKYITALGGGSTFGSISRKNLLDIALPYPIEDEQQKIADFLSAVDDKISLVERKLEQAKKFKKALLQQMFV